MKVGRHMIVRVKAYRDPANRYEPRHRLAARGEHIVHDVHFRKFETGTVAEPTDALDVDSYDRQFAASAQRRRRSSSNTEVLPIRLRPNRRRLPDRRPRPWRGCRRLRAGAKKSSPLTGLPNFDAHRP